MDNVRLWTRLAGPRSSLAAIQGEKMGVNVLVFEFAYHGSISSTWSSRQRSLISRATGLQLRHGKKITSFQ